MREYYKDSLVTIYHGDCREILPTACPSPGLLLMDPPYGIGWRGSHYRNPSKATTILHDEDTAVRDAILAMYPEVPALVFGSFRAAIPVGVREVLAWRKAEYGTGLVGNRLPWLKDWDPIFVLGNWPDQTPSRSGMLASRERSAAAYSGYITRAGHSHAKPVDTLIELLEASPSGIVLDPCTGSGSVLVAAKFVGRQSIGIEIEERYCEIAAERCRQEVLAL